MTVYNFSAGPAVLPKEVIKKIQKELPSVRNSGMSILEISHRSQLFVDILNDAKQNIKELLNVPDNYHILFTRGGGTGAFSSVPLNLANKHKKIAFLDSGHWTNGAINEARNLGYEADVLNDTKDVKYQRLPFTNKKLSSDEYDYLYFTTNNTVEGTAYHSDNLPEHGDIPLVTDMSSNFLAEHYDVKDFGLLFAGAQKNAGPAGVAITIVRDDLVHPAPHTPKILDYEPLIKKNSAPTTPPVFAIYVVGLVTQWLKEHGGVDAIEKLNKKEANLLYDFLDNSELFNNDIPENERSLTNITFSTGDQDLDAKLAKQADQDGFKNINGHRVMGGLRVSIYNGMPIEWVEALVDYLKKFEANQ